MSKTHNLFRRANLFGVKHRLKISRGGSALADKLFSRPAFHQGRIKNSFDPDFAFQGHFIRRDQSGLASGQDHRDVGQGQTLVVISNQSEFVGLLNEKQHTGFLDSLVILEGADMGSPPKISLPAVHPRTSAEKQQKQKQKRTRFHCIKEVAASPTSQGMPS